MTEPPTCDTSSGQYTFRESIVDSSPNFPIFHSSCIDEPTSEDEDVNPNEGITNVGSPATAFGDVEKQIRQYIVNRKTTVTEEDTEDELVGMDFVKNAIIEAIVVPQLINIHPSMAVRAILIAGAPGTAKTLLLMNAAKLGARRLKIPISVFTVLYSEVLSSFVGESEKFLNMLFETAEEFSPSVILLDEADGFMRKRRDEDSDHSSRFKSALLTQMQGFKRNSRVLLLATTNLPYSMDEGYQRRFQERFLVRLPNETEREELFKVFLRYSESSCDVDWSLMDFKSMVNNTAGFSGDDIRNVVAKALRKKVTAHQNVAKEEQKPLIEMQDIQEILDNTKPTCAKSELKKLEKWAKKLATNHNVELTANKIKSNCMKTTKNLFCSCVCWLCCGYCLNQI